MNFPLFLVKIVHFSTCCPNTKKLCKNVYYDIIYNMPLTIF